MELNKKLALKTTKLLRAVIQKIEIFISLLD